MRTSILVSRLLRPSVTAPMIAALASATLISCDGELTEEELNDPAALFGDEEWWDEGPPDAEGSEHSEHSEDSEDVAAGEDDLLADTAIAAMPGFQLPFPCGQVWAGQTRTNHSPQRAIDFNRADDIGDPVVAAAGGTVTRVANEGNVSYGRWVEIDHGSGYRTRYAHLSTQSVAVGQSVSKGQKIGTVGNTGGSSGAHLHFELRLNGSAIKPVFNGNTALFFGTKNYKSANSCGGGGTGGVPGTVNTAGAPLNVRSAPSTSAGVVGSVADGASIKITCQKHGSTVSGTYGTTSLWDYIGTGYISDAYVHTGSDGQVAPTCK